MTKKILFIETQSEFGGAQRFIYTFISGLKSYEIVVAAGIEGDDERGLLRTLEKIGISTRRLKYLRRGINPLFDLCLGIIEIYRLIKKEKPDVLFLCSSKAGALGGLAGRLANVPKIIYRIGGWTFNDPWPKWKKKIYILIEKWTAKFKDIIVNNAESDRQQAIKLGIKPKERIVTIYNGIDVNKLNFLSREEARQEIFDKIINFSAQGGPASGWQLVGTIANLYPAKGLEYFIEAASIIRKRFVGVKFIVIGEGMERLKLKELIKKYHLEDSFFLVGAASSAYKYLKAFDIFVLPSVKEGFPWVILEAMAAGVPIVATKVGAIPKIIEDKETALLVEPGHAKELSQAILELLDDYSFRTRMAENAKKVVEANFSLEKMVKEVEKLF